MKKRFYVKPTKPALVAGLIVVIAMLLFGVIFLVTLAQEGAGMGVSFMSLWILVVLVIGGMYAYNLFSHKDKVGVGEEISSSDMEEGEESSFDFDERLRKLESLWKEKIITESEYRKKRNEILGSKW